jgi:hypothetical protein
VVHPKDKIFDHKNYAAAGCQWLMPVLLPTWEAEMERIAVRGKPRQKVCEIPQLQNNQVPALQS